MKIYKLDLIKDKIKVGDYIGTNKDSLFRVTNINSKFIEYGINQKINSKDNRQLYIYWIPLEFISLLDRFLEQLIELRSYQELIDQKCMALDRLELENLALKENNYKG